MLLRSVIRFFKKEEKTVITSNKEHRATMSARPGLHAQSLNNPPRHKAREHNLPKCKYRINPGHDKAVRFRVVDKLEHNARNLLRDPPLRLPVVAEAKELQQQDRRVEHRDSDLRAVVR